MANKKYSVTNTTRDLTELHPLVEAMLIKALAKIKLAGIEPLIVETYRPKERQYYLYGKGRTESICRGAGMPSDKAKMYAKPNDTKCTWTLDSIHIQRRAVDLIPQVKNSKGNYEAIWNSNDPKTKKIISIMQSVGFEPGANWKNSPDSPHFQVAGISNIKKEFSKNNTNKFVTTAIQKALKKKGFYDGYEVDGIWGKATDNAIKKWKKSQGWSQKACIGTRAINKLF